MKLALLGMTALAAMVFATPANAVLLHNYDLNGSLADSLGGPSLTANGGTLGATGYSFGANQGLTLSGLGIAADGAYSIELGFSFAATSGYRKIIDFSSLASDRGLYVLNTALNFYPVTTGAGGSFLDNQLSNLVLTRTTAGLVTGSVNGVQKISFLDSGAIALSNKLNFFIDDFETGQGEASRGYVDYIRISGTGAPVSPVPLPPALPLLAAALGGFGWISRRRRAKAV